MTDETVDQDATEQPPVTGTAPVVDDHDMDAAALVEPPTATAAVDPLGLSPLPLPPEPVVEDVALEQLVPLEEDTSPVADIAMLLDVPLEVAVQLGRATVTIRELLELGQGAILQLDRHAGEPVDLLVNGRCLARGEVVVIDEDFGIRVTNVVPAEERLRGIER